ncbi:hypothetical protein Droror1_Dr00020776 [Drosera rotundifolia]
MALFTVGDDLPPACFSCKTQELKTPTPSGLPYPSPQEIILHSLVTNPRRKISSSATMAVESDAMSRIGKSKSKEQSQKVKDEKEEVVMVKKREVKEKKQGRELRWKRKDATAAKGKSLRPLEKWREGDDRDDSTSMMPLPSVSCSLDSEWANSLNLTCLSNLERFLKYTTPVVPALCFSKTSMRGWRDKNEEYIYDHILCSGIFGSLLGSGTYTGLEFLSC